MTNTTRRVSTAEAKAKLSELIGAVAYRGDTVVIERRGKPVAALVAIEAATQLVVRDAVRRRRGALALLGAWSELEDDVIDNLVLDIYEARSRDLGRPVEL